MRICFLAINYWPEETGIAVYNTGKCEYLASRGHDVTIVTAFPYYPQWRVADSYRGKIISRESHNGVTILRTWLYIPSQVTAVRRVIHEASFVASALLRSFACTRPDLLYAVSPPLALGLSAALSARRWRIPLALHVPDLQPDAAFDLNMLPSGPIAKLLYGLERFNYRRAHLISTLSEAMRQRIISKGVTSDKVVVLSDWADSRLFQVQSDGAAFRARHGVGDRFLVVHSGNMGVKQGLGVIVDAALLSRDDPTVLYLLVGDGAARRELENCVEQHRLSNVRMLPLLPRDEFRELLAASDVCLVTQQQNVGDIVFPSKVTTLLAAGRPVVASVNRTSEVARVVEEAGAGVIVPAEDPHALHASIHRLRNEPGTRETMTRRGREYARQKWNVDSVLAATEAALHELGNTA